MRGLILVGLLAVIGLEAGQSYGVQNDYQPGQDVPAPVQAAPSYYVSRHGGKPHGGGPHGGPGPKKVAEPAAAS
ncbi:unnamed protein product, partial [Mesorhabditis spiculigera]